MQLQRTTNSSYTLQLLNSSDFQATANFTIQNVSTDQFLTTSEGQLTVSGLHFLALLLHVEAKERGHAKCHADRHGDAGNERDLAGC